MQNLIELYKLPMFYDNYDVGAYINTKSFDIILKIEYYNGVTYYEEILFENSYSYSFVGRDFINNNNFIGSINTIVLKKDSEYIDYYNKKYLLTKEKLKHFVIYIDDFGQYDFFATDYRVINKHKKDIDFEKLSKEISYALRHNPKKYKIGLDKNGWADINQLVTGLISVSKWYGLEKKDIEKMVGLSTKKRHEIKGDMIRAYYGHSTPGKIELESVRPPDVLYHGTTETFIKSIMKEGLQSKGRQYIHMSVDIETAKSVASRRKWENIILIIDAMSAYNDGVNFYHGNESVWLSEEIPAKYIEKLVDNISL